MPQTLRKTFSLQPHHAARRPLLPAHYHASCNSLEGLLSALQQFLAKAKTDLLQPRQQVIDRILHEAALLH